LFQETELKQRGKGDSDVAHSDDEKDEDFTPGIEEGEEEEGKYEGGSDEHTDTDTYIKCICMYEYI